MRWSVWTRAGFAWAGTSYRQGGVAVHAAAQDVERLRRLFSAEIGEPTRTILHGQSWGASVAAVAAETYTVRNASGKPPFDAVLLTSGVLGGGTRSYDFRLDLRVVYQAVCGNHPRPDEAQYPLWQGLPPGSSLTRAELRARVNACTGVDDPAGPRSDVQRHRLKTLLDVIHIPARSLVSHLQWATYHFQDIVFKRLGGRNPFGNEGVRYRGSDDDDALNARVARYRADPAAVAAFAADTDPTGRIPVPVLTVHGIGDPTAFVELESTWRETMQRAGTAGHLVQVFTGDHEHSYLSDAEYVSAMHALLGWIERGKKPTPAGIAAQCHALAAAFDPARGCRFLPQYQPQPLAMRVPVRIK
jgi:pimeloyl-ACP methyl ester carboxylesterase